MATDAEVIAAVDAVANARRALASATQAMRQAQTEVQTQLDVVQQRKQEMAVADAALKSANDALRVVIGSR